MRAKQIYEFTRGGDPLDTMGIGVNALTHLGFDSFFYFLKKINNNDQIDEEECLNIWYTENDVDFFDTDKNIKKQKLVFNGYTIEELFHLYNSPPTKLDGYYHIYEYLVEIRDWPKMIIHKYKFYNLTRDAVENTYQNTQFIHKLILYFIDKWDGKIKLK